MSGYFSEMVDLVSVWAGDPFRMELTEWLDGKLSLLGLDRRGPVVPVRVRFWSAVFRVEVSGQGHEQVWVKVGNPGQAFEGVLLQALSHVVPDLVVTPLVVDGARGWWVLPDGGPTVLMSEGHETATVWGQLLGQVALLQRLVTERRAELSAVPALPLECVVDEVDHLLLTLGSLEPGNPRHLTSDAVASARTGLSRLEAAMRMLSRLGIPDTLQPNDVSPANAFLPRRPGGPYRLFDMGDAFWSHPFGVLHLPLRVAVGSSLAGPLPAGSTVRRLAADYLRLWPEVPERLWPEVLQAGDRLGAVHRALSWHRLLAHVDTASLKEPPQVGV